MLDELADLPLDYLGRVLDLLIILALGGLLWLCLRLRARQNALRLQVAQQWNDLLGIHRALVGVAEAEAEAPRQRQREDQREREDQRQLEEQRQIERQRQLEARLEMLAEQQQQLMLRDADTVPYLQAIRHAQRGASVEELVSAYDLARPEAELIVTLHGAGARPE